MNYSPWAQDPCIMVVDERDETRRAARDVLERDGFKVLTARNSVEALVIAADYPLAIDALITDSGMRVHQNGLELARCFGVLRPETRVVITGSPEELEGVVAPGDDGWIRLAKPFDRARLLGAARRALDLLPVRSAA